MAIKSHQANWIANTSDLGFYLNHCWLFRHQSPLLPTSSNRNQCTLEFSRHLPWLALEATWTRLWKCLAKNVSARPWQPWNSEGLWHLRSGKICRKQRTQHMETCATRWVQTQSILFQNSSEKNDSFNSLYPLTKFLTGWGIQKHPKSIAASIAAPVPVMRNRINQRKSKKVWLQIHCAKSLWNPWSWAPGLFSRATR